MSKIIPGSVSVKSSLNTTNQYKFEVASDRFLTAPLMNFIVFNAITASERALGEMTLYVSGQIHLKNQEDRKSTRLNSSHQIISYAVFCLKKKKKTTICTN